ncbi:hypothetical protein R4670_16505 [Acinetobacter baumannii]|uniref:hypothetical protein n=1 Tax=Acinetobacter baumannii TaxID=470 RepID=UPI00044ECD85|nr:hypothetical protein [Acinetobacter baumannii]AOM87237.1 hypothetical protein AN158_13715 [Acinetobacter baumannii]EXB99035.1 hypothetical protein J539_2663 [Acinetobacter baumannii 342950]MCU7398280.1 hypothetical protein [Acinetobacter baumannii]MDV7620234.1 hypothetical protein [Acinetobacter baumannii]
MNSSKKPYSVDQLNEILTNFDFYNTESNCFYRNYENVLQRYSQHLSKWILELDKGSINLLQNIEKKNITNAILTKFLLNNKIPKNTKEVNDALKRHGW